MKRYDQYEYMRYFNIVLHERKAIYFFVPKVACTSLKRTMAEELGYEKQSMGARLASRFGFGVKQTEQSWHWQHYPFVVDASKFDDYFKFAFVRNPWSRLVSCYKNKLQTDYSGFKRYGFQKSMSFGEFAKGVSEVPDQESDMHFRSQSVILNHVLDNKLDFIGRLESFDNDFSYVLKRIGLSQRKEVKLMQSGASDSWRSFYNEDLVDMVAQRYSADIERFGYSTESLKV